MPGGKPLGNFLSYRSLPILTAPLSPVTAAKITFGAVCLVLILILGRFASPAHLTRVLSDDMACLENTYTDVASTGIFRLFPADEVESVISSLRLLRLKVGHLEAETLRNSRSFGTLLCEFLKGRSVTLYRCIHEVRDLEKHIRILEKEHLNRSNSNMPWLLGFPAPHSTVS
ncbi:hypothetical protein C8R46DRAFT_1070690 [Mycena filopes]|nr:hypothetical protein C8R46DRAFT_1070690 [Mycena filopes]